MKRKPLALLAAIAISLGMGAGVANAADTQTITPTAKQTITISNTEADRPFRAIELAKYTAAQTADGKVSALTVETKTDVRTPIENAAKKSGYTDTSRDPMEWVANTLTESDHSTHAGTLRDFVTRLAADQTIQTSGTTFTGTTSPALEAGVYLILDQSANDASLPMLVGTTVEGLNNTAGTLGTVALKTTTVTAPHKTATVNGKTGTEVNAKVGDIVHYEVAQTVPNTTGYTRYYLALNDRMADGLTFQTLDSVTLDGKTMSGTLYHETHTDHTLNVTFGDKDGDILSGGVIRSGSVIKIAYSAKVNTNAVSGAEGNPNKVDVEYSDLPADWTHHGTTPGDGTVKVYVGGFTLHKVGEDGKPIDGASFTVSEKGSTTPLKFTKNADGSYTYDPDHGTITSLPAGVLKVGGLNGEYTITETSSPYGSHLLPSFTATISADKNGNHSTVARDPVLDLSHNLDNGDIQVKNIRNISQLPSTGLAGIGMWAAIILLLGGCGLALTRKARASK